MANDPEVSVIRCYRCVVGLHGRPPGLDQTDNPSECTCACHQDPNQITLRKQGRFSNLCYRCDMGLHGNDRVGITVTANCGCPCHDEVRLPGKPKATKKVKKVVKGQMLPNPFRTKTSPSANVRAQVYERDGLRCRYCGVQLNEFTATLDHKKPKSHGGSNKPANLVTSCKDCNHRKGDRTPEEAGMSVLPIGATCAADLRGVPSTEEGGSTAQREAALDDPPD